jgi:hypothetical protein
MDVVALITKSAWLPLTPRGVAAFASASGGRLRLVQLVFAVASSVAVGWFLNWAWAPTIREAIQALPDQSSIRAGRLEWTGASPTVLAEGRFIGFTVDLEHRGLASTSSDIVVELGATDWQISSLLGALDVPGLWDTTYPRNYSIALNKQELGPWWGAREPILIAASMGATVLLLMLSWMVLAALYLPFVRLGAFYSNRLVTLSGCWRLAGAALMPGAMFLSAAIVLYGLEAFNLLRLALAFAMHLVVGWVYAAAATVCLPRIHTVPPAGTNPFKSTEGSRPAA